MADTDRCAVCGAEIPEGVHICRKCEMLVNEGERRRKERELEEAFEIAPALCEIKRYCNERRERLGECGQCPIKSACLNEVRLWEV